MGKKKVCDRFCRDCIYYYGWYEVNLHCNYILVESKVRGCDPGKGCTRKIKVDRTGRRKRCNEDLIGGFE